MNTSIIYLLGRKLCDHLAFGGALDDSVSNGIYDDIFQTLNEPLHGVSEECKRAGITKEVVREFMIRGTEELMPYVVISPTGETANGKRCMLLTAWMFSDVVLKINTATLEIEQKINAELLQEEHSDRVHDTTKLIVNSLIKNTRLYRDNNDEFDYYTLEDRKNCVKGKNQKVNMGCLVIIIIAVIIFFATLMG